MPSITAALIAFASKLADEAIWSVQLRSYKLQRITLTASTVKLPLTECQTSVYQSQKDIIQLHYNELLRSDSTAIEIVLWNSDQRKCYQTSIYAVSTRGLAVSSIKADQT